MKLNPPIALLLILLAHGSGINRISAQSDELRLKKSENVKAILDVSRAYSGKGNIFLMNSSHQDIAWMDSPEKCIIERDTMLLTPLYNRALQDPSYRFDVEDALMLKEFIGRHPDRKEGIRQLLKNGQLSCGSSFIQPYEEMYSGEALARQFYFGARWLKKEFGYEANTYWNPDVPGKTLQMPQILSKAGTRYMLISRFEKGVYNWYSPDNSFVTAYSPGHYAESFTSLQAEFPDAAGYLARNAADWKKYFNGSYEMPVIPVLSDWDMSPAKDYSSLIGQWNNLRSVPNPDGSKAPVRMPGIRLSLTPEFIGAFVENASDIPIVRGERPAVWLYIHGPTHYQAIKASREGDILLTAAEKFATAGALARGSFAGYPEQELAAAWEAKIYPDHGWGGKHGDITDDLFLSKYVYARNSAEKIAGFALRDIASRIQTRPERGIPVVVFNSLGWTRSDPVSVTLSFERSEAKSISLADAKGDPVPVQLTGPQFFDDGSLQSVTLWFIARQVPSIGYRTYYARPLQDAAVTVAGPAGSDRYENTFYRLEFAAGGLSVIYDKELKREIADTRKMKAGEVFTLHSEGNGAGEFADVQQPDMKDFDKASNYAHNWKMDESGDVFTSFVNRQPIRNAVIEEKIITYRDLKRIDFEISLLNYEGILYREYRMALPVNMADGKISYEVPFGMLTVGQDEINRAAGERYIVPCTDVHPRGIENFISMNNDAFGVTLSSGVAVVDYVDPTGQTPGNSLIQPILLSSRRSCHGEGNEYLQTGNHHFSFSLLSHKPGWENGFRFGRQANEKLMAVAAPERYAAASLPEELSFISVDNDNLVISALKKAEDDNGTTIRLYNISGKPLEARISCFKPIREGFRANLIEEIQESRPVREGKLDLKSGPFSIETLLFR